MKRWDSTIDRFGRKLARLESSGARNAQTRRHSFSRRIGDHRRQASRVVGLEWRQEAVPEMRVGSLPDCFATERQSVGYDRPGHAALSAPHSHGDVHPLRVPGSIHSLLFRRSMALAPGPGPGSSATSAACPIEFPTAIDRRGLEEGGTKWAVTPHLRHLIQCQPLRHLRPLPAVARSTLSTRPVL
jgi:hypothetical protein